MKQSFTYCGSSQFAGNRSSNRRADIARHKAGNTCDENIFPERTPVDAVFYQISVHDILIRQIISSGHYRPARR